MIQKRRHLISLHILISSQLQTLSKAVFGWGKMVFPKNHFPWKMFSQGKLILCHIFSRLVQDKLFFIGKKYKLNNFNGEKYPPNDHIKDRY